MTKTKQEIATSLHRDLVAIAGANYEPRIRLPIEAAIRGETGGEALEAARAALTAAWGCMIEPVPRTVHLCNLIVGLLDPARTITLTDLRVAYEISLGRVLPKDYFPNKSTGSTRNS